MDVIIMEGIDISRFATDSILVQMIFIHYNAWNSVSRILHQYSDTTSNQRSCFVQYMTANFTLYLQMKSLNYLKMMRWHDYSLYNTPYISYNSKILITFKALILMVSHL